MNKTEIICRIIACVCAVILGLLCLFKAVTIWGNEYFVAMAILGVGFVYGGILGLAPEVE